jgi:histidine triad (HIT) family protein
MSIHWRRPAHSGLAGSTIRILCGIADACVFCEIVAGERPAHFVHEADSVVAFMDQFRQPADVAHVLVIPRAHVENIYGIDYSLGADLFSAHVLVARAIKSAFAPDGIRTWSSNERGANQEVPHFHLHVYPRRVGVPFPPTVRQPEAPVTDETLGPNAERLRRALKTMPPD